MERIALGEAAVGGEAPIPELSAGEDQTQSTGRHSILVLDLSLEIPDRVGWIDLEGNCPTRESSDENLQSCWDQRRRLDGGSGRRSRPAARMSLALGLLPFSSSVRAAQVASRSERHWLAGSRRRFAGAPWSVCLVGECGPVIPWLGAVLQVAITDEAGRRLVRCAVGG